MNNIKVSILMPSLNVGKYITECIESVLAQTLKDIEIICIDAGSTDGTLEVLCSFASKDSRIKIINSPVKSYGYQMNLGIDAANGEYIGIVETDDYIPEVMFEKLYDHVSDNKADFVKSRYTEFGGNGENKKFHYVGKPLTDGISGQLIRLDEHPELRLCDVNHIWSGLYKKSFLTENGIRFNETPGASFQDTSFSVLVGCLAETCIYTSDSYYFYRIDNSGSSVKQTSKIRCIVDEFEYISSELNKRDMYSAELQNIIGDLKLFLYCWNYNRLTYESRCEFIRIIQNEMTEYTADRFPFIEKPDKAAELSLLRGEHIDDPVTDDSVEALSRLADAVKSGKRFCVVGAGNFGKYVCSINEQFGPDFIEAFADNSSKVIGTEICGCPVMSVEAAVRCYNEHEWIIAVKNHKNELHDQLTALGISDEHIFYIDRFYSFQQLFRYFG